MTAALLPRAAVIGTAAALIGLMLRRSNPEMSLLLGLAAAGAILAMTAAAVPALRETVRLVRGFTGLEQTAAAPVVKCVAVGILARLAADLCRDAGQSGVASAVELCGAACALLISLPLVNAFLTMLGGLA